MSTGTDIINEALQKIGASSIVSPAAPESIELGMRVLNSMMELWRDRGIKLGTTPLKVPGDNLNEVPSARNAIVSQLALALSADFDNGKVVVSQELKAAAFRDFRDIKVLYQESVIPDKVASSTLPLGAGNNRIFAN